MFLFFMAVSLRLLFISNINSKNILFFLLINYKEFEISYFFHFDKNHFHFLRKQFWEKELEIINSRQSK